MQLRHIATAAGAFAHHHAGRGEQILGSLDDLIGPHQLLEHGADPGHEVLRGQLSALDLSQPVLPFSGQQGRLQLLRQHGDKGHRIMRGQELHGFLALFAFQKAGGHQLFQDTGAGGRGPQPLALGIVRHIVLPSSLHRRKQRILGEVLGRGGLALLDGSTRKGQRLTFRQLRQSLVLGFRLHIFQPCAVCSVQRPPAVIFHRAAFGGKLRTGALHNNGGFRKNIGLSHSAQ